MRSLLVIVALTTPLLQLQAQNLSPAEQKQLLEEVKLLREKVKILESKSAPASKVSPDMMETLRKGQKYQEDQQRALDELDKDD